MLAVNSVVELVGPRVALHRPPRGTPSRVLALRLQRCSSFHQPGPQAAGAGLCSANSSIRASRLNSQGRGRTCTDRSAHEYSTWSDFTPEKNSRITADDAGFLAKLVSQHAENEVFGTAKVAAGFGYNKRQQSIVPDMSGNSNSRFPEALAYPFDLQKKFPGPFQKAIEALQQRNSRKLLIYVQQIANMAQDELVSAVDALPRTTFSEFLRSLDPLKIGADNDPTYGTHIGPGMWQMLNMGSIVDEWGVRKLYVRLLHQMLTLMRALQMSGRVLNINDYIPLLRAAGVASDVSGVKLLWEQTIDHEIRIWRHSDSYNEYINARLLINPMYVGYDKTRTMMKPRNLHRRAKVNLSSSRQRLDRLRFNIRKRSFRFGLNKNAPHAEDLSRILRKPGPANRLFFYTVINGYRLSEKLLLSCMIGIARAGSLRFIQFRILEDYYGICVRKDASGQIEVRAAKPKTVVPREPWRPMRARYQPSEHLMRAIIEAYCGNGQLATAFSVIDYISSTYNIPIKPDIWFELLEWTHIFSCPPVSTSWKMAGLNDRVPNATAVEMVWNTMTSAPYNVQPGFKQYHFLISSFLARKRYDKAIEHMRIARKFYQDQATAYETAVFEYTRDIRAGVDVTASLRAYQRTRFMKQYMWHKMARWCKTFLQKFRTNHLQDTNASRVIPGFIREWREWVDNPAQYRTATGYIVLVDPAEEFMRRRVTIKKHVLQVPMRYKRRWRLQHVTASQRAVLSSHSLADQTSARISPLALLGGKFSTFRTPELREDWRKIKSMQKSSKNQEHDEGLI